MGGGLTAAVIIGAGTLELVEATGAELGPGEVRVRIEGCGVCGSDLPVWTGRSWFEYPRDAGSPGHEGWGTIEAIGPEVSDLRPGQRVSGLGYRSYASHDVMKAVELVVLPEALLGQPFPGEALGCAINVFRRSQITEEHIVAVVGIGFLGALLTQLAARAGARVIAVSRRPYALRVAQAMGASDTVTLDEPVVERVAELTQGRLCDVVVEAAGTQRTLDIAGPLTRTRGRLVIAGFHQDGPRQVDMQMWNWRGLDVINAHEREQAVYLAGIREAAAAVADGRLDPAPLYTHRFSLERLDDAMETAVARPDGFMKALVTA
jgi:threonine dehydrogenase-like Zn-dependent dehydrogenase